MFHLPAVNPSPLRTKMPIAVSLRQNDWTMTRPGMVTTLSGLQW